LNRSNYSAVAVQYCLDKGSHVRRHLRMRPDVPGAEQVKKRALPEVAATKALEANA
jgi:hypothetical protein